MSEINGSALKECLATIELGIPQEHEEIAIVPVLGGKFGSTEYLTLGEALAGSLLRVTEVDSAGSIPELKVMNAADIPVILLDGEELAGAKQNRILNATILLREKSETLIPVSCTESGRWSSRSEAFSDSGHISPHRLRMNKMHSVTESLAASAGFRSDQGRVWEEIDRFQAEAGHHSPTNAMRDVLEAHKASIGSYVQAFPPVEGQRGLIVLVDGVTVGFDILSHPRAYASLHEKLVRSYVMDALVSRTTTGTTAAVDVSLRAMEIVAEAAACVESSYKSIGHGWDLRYTSRSLVGSALVHEKGVVHAAFFRVTPEETNGRTGLASMRSRRRSRIDR